MKLFWSRAAGVSGSLTEAEGNRRWPPSLQELCAVRGSGSPSEELQMKAAAFTACTMMGKKSMGSWDTAATWAWILLPWWWRLEAGESWHNVEDSFVSVCRSLTTEHLQCPGSTRGAGSSIHQYFLLAVPQHAAAPGGSGRWKYLKTPHCSGWGPLSAYLSCCLGRFTACQRLESGMWQIWC